MNLENVADVYPLTPTQEGMLFHSIADDATGAYVDQIVFDLQGDLHFDRLQSCIQAIFGQYDILRTAFVWDGVDQPLQVVRETVEFPVTKLSWLDVTCEEQEKRLEELIRHEANEAFVVEQAPLVRVRVISTSPETWNLLIVFHHLVLDGWSVSLLAKKLISEYCGQGLIQGDTAPQFREYVSWNAQQDHDKAIEYWRRELTGFEEKNRIGTVDHSEVEQLDPRFAQRTLRLSSHQSQTLEDFARSQRITLNTLMVAAWSLTVARYSGQNDVVFGRTVAGRPTEVEHSQTAIGNFINTLPFRTCLQRQTPVTQWLQQLQDRQIEQTELEFSSLVSIQKQTDIPAGERLFDSILVFENYPSEDLVFDRLRVTNVRHFEQSNYPLAILVVPSKSGIELLMIYDTSAYSEWFVDRLLNFVCSKLEELVSSVDLQMHDLMSTLPAYESEHLKQIFTPQSDSTEKRTVIDLLAEVVRRSPDSLAAVCDGKRISYRELDEKSNQVAHQLRRHGVETAAAIGICVERSIEMLAAIFGVLKSGNYYVPLDLVYPREHFAHVIEDAGISTILTRREYMDRLPVNDDGNLILFEEMNSGVDPIEVKPSQDQLAYAIYTSGSTGKPKGVMIDHRNLVESTLARSHYYRTNPAAYLLLSSFAFDSSVAGIFWTLCTGGKLVMPRPEGEKDTFELCQLIRGEGVTHLLCLPVLYRLIVDACQDKQLDSLEAAIVAGEAITRDVVIAHQESLREHSKDWKLFNEYGPTENSVWATVQEIQDGERQHFPIGKPICNTGVAILDSEAVPVPVGALGEIALTGSGLSRGYIGADELTDKKFKSGFNHFGHQQRIYLTGDLGFFDSDGAIVFAGRKDRQVKVRGYRVELEEIEAVLATLSGVNEIAVQLQDIGPNQKQMVCYFAGEKPSDRNHWQSEIGDRLPDFMIPDAFIGMESLPKLPNGKINRKRLRPIEFVSRSTALIAPRNEIEKTLVQIWREVLGVSEVSVQDNFFSLGGDSILSIQVISRARRSGLVVKPGDIGLYPTIEDLAARIKTDSRTDTSAQSLDASMLSSMQQWFFDQNLADANHWNLSQLFDLSSECDFSMLHQAIHFVLASHPAFQYRFVSAKGRREIDPGNSNLDFEVQQFDESNQQELLGIQEQLDLENGPLFRLGLLKKTDGCSQLLFVVHHLVIDLVSWQILIDDIEYVYRLIEKGETPELPNQSTSFAQWVDWCARQAEAVDSSEIDYWNSIATDVKWADTDHKYLERDCETVVASLDADLTRELLGPANSAYNTRIQDLLLAGLGNTLTQWHETDRVVIELESHGRETGGSMDLSRTVGWFTATFPFELEFKSADISGSIKRIKEKVRFVPGEGVLFNALCNAKIVHDCQTDVLFNYHGRRQVGHSSGILTPVPGGHENARALSNHRAHGIEINVLASERLEISWRYDRIKFQKQLIEDVAKQFITNLEEIVKHCRSGKTQFTPSDFVESGLSQSELDDFLEDFD